MPHYFFNVFDGERLDDEEGQELPDITAARIFAVRSARSIMAEEIRSGRLPIHESIEIVDRRGRVVMTVGFRETIEIANDPSPIPATIDET